jgi:predicted MFS family arabinose efflux permease
VHNVTALFIVQIISGFLKTISAPAFDTIYARHLDRSSTGQEYGVWEASFFMTAGVGAVLGGTVVSLYGFSGVFITMAVLAFIAAAYIAVLNDKILK